MLKKTYLMLRSYLEVLNMDPRASRVAERLEARRPEKKDSPLWLHLLLFAVTAVTTTLAGAETRDTIAQSMASGLPFSATIMSILLAHEMGHYLAARRFGIRATLPYFIPFPSLIGTMGAVIRIKSRIHDRRALLYIGAMGPVAGFVLSLAASIIGVYLSEIKLLPAGGKGDIPIFGNSLLFEIIIRSIHGVIPAGHDIYLSPYAWAGWIGFLITSLNLMPMGQLDGSHILYALIGRRQLWFGWTAFIGLAVLSFIWPGWIIWIIMALSFLMIGHPPIPPAAEFTRAEKVLGWCCMAVFVLTFIPVPVDFI